MADDHRVEPPATGRPTALGDAAQADAAPGDAASGDPGSGDTARAPARQAVVHGTAVAWLGNGVLLLGASGSGKSDLALRLIDSGALLVADDLVRLEAVAGQLIARSPGDPGLLELRGHGIYRLPAREQVRITLVLRLGEPGDDAERLPPPECVRLAGIDLCCARLRACSSSAVARVRLLLTGERVY